MTKLLFDNPQGIIFVDGIRCNDFASTDRSFCIEYVPYDDNYLPIKRAVNGKFNMFDDVVFIRHNKDYIVRFCPKRRLDPTQNEIYIQKVLEPSTGKSHCLTCHKESTYKISVETKEEYITIDTPCKTTDVKFSCLPISNGQLLTVFATLENCKTHVCVLHYKDDYTLLLNICCDEVTAEEDGLYVCDRLHDTLDRKCIRKLSFCGDCFVEQSRHFENSCNHSYIDAIIPYVLVESVCYGDVDCVKNCLAPSLRNCDLNELLGDFVGICDCLDYTPYEIALMYSDFNGLYTKTFKFDVSQGKIHKIKLS